MSFRKVIGAPIPICTKSELQWEQLLFPAQYEVLRQGRSQAPFQIPASHFNISDKTENCTPVPQVVDKVGIRKMRSTRKKWNLISSRRSTESETICGHSSSIHTSSSKRCDKCVQSSIVYFACSGCFLPVYDISSRIRLKEKSWLNFSSCYQGCVESASSRISVGTFQPSSVIRPQNVLHCASCRGCLGQLYVGEGLTASKERHVIYPISVRPIRLCDACVIQSAHMKYKNNIGGATC